MKMRGCEDEKMLRRSREKGSVARFMNHMSTR